MDDKEPYHDYCGPSRTFVSLPLVFVFGEDDGDDDMARCHADCTDDEDGFAAQFVDVENGGHGGEPHDDTNDTTCQQRRCGSGKT